MVCFFLLYLFFEIFNITLIGITISLSHSLIHSLIHSLTHSLSFSFLLFSKSSILAHSRPLCHIFFRFIPLFIIYFFFFLSSMFFSYFISAFKLLSILSLFFIFVLNPFDIFVIICISWFFNFLSPFFSFSL